MQVVPKLSPGSIFYHFIDARRRTPDRIDDFSKWLFDFDYKYIGLIEEIAKVDPYFATLTEIQIQLSLIFKEYFGKSDEDNIK